jgi:hypothetical protein
MTDKKPETSPSDQKERDLELRQARVMANTRALQESVDYAKEVIAKSEKLRKECAMLMFGKVDPSDMVASAPMEMRQEVYELLRPYCSEEDLEVLNVDGAVAQESQPLAKRLRSKAFI